MKTEAYQCDHCHRPISKEDDEEFIEIIGVISVKSKGGPITCNLSDRDHLHFCSWDCMVIFLKNTERIQLRETL